jgi:transcriptional regulator with XRE-family HTH domain
MAVPFGQAVFLWRRHRGLTQQQLADRARLPRPNLCAIEQGRREVSLTTLRALALALEVPAGALVEGAAPPLALPPVRELSRAVLERVSRAAATERMPAHPAERRLVELLRAVVAPARGRRRSMEAAWLTLQAWYPRDTVRTLLERAQARTRLDVA